MLSVANAFEISDFQEDEIEGTRTGRSECNNVTGEIAIRQAQNLIYLPAFLGQCCPWRWPPVPGELIRRQPNDRLRETRCEGETPDDFLGNSAEGDLIS